MMKIDTQALLTPGKSKPALTYNLKKIWHPSWFQGNNKTKNYFEGWYIKLVDKTRENAWAFIPGISLHGKNRHAFVQAINGNTGQTWYFKYPLSSFQYAHQDFLVKIDKNVFSNNFIQLDIENDEGVFRGRVDFSNQTPLRASLRRPGIMGWYRYVPFMECYHGLVSMNHRLSGNLIMDEYPSSGVGIVTAFFTGRIAAMAAVAEIE